jgi:hypothetical protein
MARHDEEPEVPSRTSHTVGTPAHVVAAALDLDARDVADRYGFAPPTLLGILTGIERSLAEIGAADATTAKSIFVEADDALGPRRDLDLFRWFRQEDVEAWDRYVNASARLVLGLFSPLGMPICSRESLIVRTEAAVRDLESDSERQIKEGLGLDRRQPDFHDRLLMHVYPIRPYWLTTYPVDDLRPLTADQVHPTRQSFLDALEPSASAQGAAMPPARSPEAADQGEAGVDVGSVKFAWLSPSDAARLADVRANLLDLKIDILHHLVRTLRTGDATAVWSGCLKLLTEALTASDVQFLLRMDHRLSQAGVLAEERSNAAAVPGRGCWVPLGRLVDLLLFAGYCEEELTVGMMHALSRRWPRPVLYDPLIFKANEQALQAVPYAAFDELVRLEAQQFDFWKRWADRLHAALRKEFKAAVTLEFSIK